MKMQEVRVKTILALVDFSSSTDPVVDMACRLAAAPGARVCLLHVASPDPDFVGYEIGPQTVRDSRAASVRKEHRLLEEMSEHIRSKGISVEALLVQGPTVEKILQESERLEVEALVMGSHGHGALRKLLVGSVAEGVLRKARRPVVVVPASTGNPA